MIVNPKKTPSKYNSKKYTVAYGIQSWLVKQGYILDPENKNQVDKAEYKKLLKEFCETRPDWKPIKHLHAKEGFISKRANFTYFQIYCHRKHGKSEF